MGLFDIDENDNEQDTSHGDGIPHSGSLNNEGQQQEDASFSMNLQAHQANTFGYLNQTYPSFPQYISDPFQSTGIQFGGYTAPANMVDSVDLHFRSLQQQQQPQQQNVYRYEAQTQPAPAKIQNVTVAPTRIKVPTSSVTGADLSLPVLHKPTPQVALPRKANSMILPPPLNASQQDLTSSSIPYEPSFPPNNISDCAVCLCQNPTSLAILKPCDHPLCSSCLTSALNIVGEKDMECAVCKRSVEDFKLINPRSQENSRSNGNKFGSGKCFSLSPHNNMRRKKN